MQDSVVECLCGGDEDVENLVLASVLFCQPEAEMSAENERLRGNSSKAQAEPGRSIF